MASTSNTAKKRKYSESYLRYGFTYIEKGEKVQPQCIICAEVLSENSFLPSKLKRHLDTKHSHLKSKDVEFFKQKEINLKRTRLDKQGHFQQELSKAVEASYIISKHIAKNKKEHTIGENLIKPCLEDVATLLLPADCAEKMKVISCSNSTVSRRIQKMSDDILTQVVTKIKLSNYFAIQLDESTDVADLGQLLVFARYVTMDNLEEEFLFCEPLTDATKASDIMEKLDTFFVEHNLSWDKLCAVCTDGAPAMVGSQSGLKALILRRNENIKFVHCMLHQHALVSKTLPDILKDTLNEVIKAINFIKAFSLNTRIFKKSVNKIIRNLKICYCIQKFVGFRRETHCAECFH